MRGRSLRSSRSAAARIRLWISISSASSPPSVPPVWPGRCRSEAAARPGCPGSPGGGAAARRPGQQHGQAFGRADHLEGGSEPASTGRWRRILRPVVKTERLHRARQIIFEPDPVGGGGAVGRGDQGDPARIEVWPAGFRPREVDHPFPGGRCSAGTRAAPDQERPEAVPAQNQFGRGRDLRRHRF